MRAALAVLALAGCGRFNIDPQPADAASSDTQLLDAMVDAAPPTGPFGAAAAVASINTGSNEDDPALTGDQLEVFFDSNRAGGLGGGDLWTASRAQAGDAFGAATNVAALNTAGDDTTPDVSRDGLTLYFVKAGSQGAKDLWVATRASRAAPWDPANHLLAASTAGDDAGPSISADGLELYFATTLSGNDDLYVSRRATTSDPFPAATPIGELNTSAADHEPWINGTRTLLVWTSDRGGNADLWFARRADPSQPWGTAQPIGELNTASPETDPWLSPDEHAIYFARGPDLFMATR